MSNKKMKKMLKKIVAMIANLNPELDETMINFIIRYNQGSLTWFNAREQAFLKKLFNFATIVLKKNGMNIRFMPFICSCWYFAKIAIMQNTRSAEYIDSRILTNLNLMSGPIKYNPQILMHYRITDLILIINSKLFSNTSLNALSDDQLLQFAKKIFPHTELVQMFLRRCFDNNTFHVIATRLAMFNHLIESLEDTDFFDVFEYLFQHFNGPFQDVISDYFYQRLNLNRDLLIACLRERHYLRIRDTERIFSLIRDHIDDINHLDHYTFVIFVNYLATTEGGLFTQSRALNIRTNPRSWTFNHRQRLYRLFRDRMVSSSYFFREVMRIGYFCEASFTQFCEIFDGSKVMISRYMYYISHSMLSELINTYRNLETNILTVIPEIALSKHFAELLPCYKLWTCHTPTIYGVSNESIAFQRRYIRDACSFYGVARQFGISKNLSPALVCYIQSFLTGNNIVRVVYESLQNDTRKQITCVPDIITQCVPLQYGINCLHGHLVDHKAFVSRIVKFMDTIGQLEIQGRLPIESILSILMFSESISKQLIAKIVNYYSNSSRRFTLIKNM